MKFQYSPGLLGYGAKGGDGSAGLQGLALYFTDFDPVFDLLRIEDCIRNDYVMWSSTPGVKLPGERVYQSGDLFVSSRGYIYQIDASEDEFANTGAALSKAEFFESHFPPIYDTIMGFERYSNIHSASTNYLIDNNFSSKSSYLVPGNIYGINLEDFTRIEFTDASAFTLYSCAEQAEIDEHKALAIFKDNDGFRIGNLESENIRDTNLTLDVSLLLVNRQDSNRIKSNTPSGTVITNAEKNSNVLFDPMFEEQPEPGIIVEPYGEYSLIKWDLSKLFNQYDPSIKGTIIFNKNQAVSGTWNINSSIFKPLIIHDVEQTGEIILTDLSIGTEYQYYMILQKDGWERQTPIKYITQGGEPPSLKINDPESKILNADYLGKFTSGSYIGSYTYIVDLSTDSITGWSTYVAPTYLWVNVAGGTGPGPLGNFDVSLLKNSGDVARIGKIDITSQAPTQQITINQSALQVSAYFDTNGYLRFSPSLTNQSMYVTMDLYIKTCAEGTSLNHRRSRKWIQIIKNGSMIKEVYSGEADGGSSHIIRDNSTGASGYSFYCNYSDIIQIKFFNQYSDGGDSWSTKAEGLDWIYGSNIWGSWHRYGGGWARIKQISKSGGDGGIIIDTSKRLYYNKRDTTSGYLYKGVQSNPPTINS